MSRRYTLQDPNRDQLRKMQLQGPPAAWESNPRPLDYIFLLDYMFWRITFFFWITCFGGLHFSFGLHVFEPASSGLHVLLSSFARSLRESIFLLFFSHSPRSQFVARSVRKPQANTFTYRPRKRG